MLQFHSFIPHKAFLIVHSVTKYTQPIITDPTIPLINVQAHLAIEAICVIPGFPFCYAQVTQSTHSSELFTQNAPMLTFNILN